MEDRILRIAEVLVLTGLSRATLYRLIESGDFPQPVRLGGRKSRGVGWRLSEVQEWIRNLAPAT